MRWMTSRMGERDRGAVLVIMTICLSLVLLGIAALALNTGTWYTERAQLQNGADSAALAVAQSCSRGTCEGAYALSTDLAVRLANKNANDNKATVDYVCGGTTTSAAGTYTGVTALSGLAPCGSGLANWTSTGCPMPPKSKSTGFVNVHTSTKTNSGNSIPVIGGLNGKPEHIKTCAQASWGFPGSGTVAPFTMSACEFYADTGAQPKAIPPVAPTFAQGPVYTAKSQLPPAYPYTSYNPDASPAQAPLPGGESVIPLHGTANVLSGGTFDGPPVPTTDSFTGSPAVNKGGPTLTGTTTYTFGGTAGALQVAWGKGGTPATGPPLSETVDAPKQKLNVGESYTATAWVYAPSFAGQPTVALYLNSTGTRGSSVTLDGSWDQVSFVFNATTANNNVIGLTNTSAIAAAGITFYVDEFSVAPTVNPRCVTAPNPPSGWDQPGGFGWLADTDGVNDCSVNVSVNNTVWDNTGASLPSACVSLLSGSTCTFATVVTSCQPKVIYVPIFDGTCSNGSTCNVSVVCGAGKPPGSNGCYHIAGFAGFVPSGYQLNGSGGLKQNSFISNKGYCNGNNKCVYGYFTGLFAHLPNGGGGGQNFGLSYFSLSG